MAAPSIAQFRTHFPEFGSTSSDGASDALVQAMIDRAAELHDSMVYGTQHMQAVLWQAADFLARSPFARDMKLVAGDGSTMYSQHVRTMKRIGAIGIRVL